jgi:hypothetical protein
VSGAEDWDSATETRRAKGKGVVLAAAGYAAGTKHLQAVRVRELEVSGAEDRDSASDPRRTASKSMVIRGSAQ